MESAESINSVFWLGTFFTLFIAFSLIFLVLFYQNRFMQMKRKEADLMLKATLETEKRERMRIAADLHDGVSGDLNSIRNYLTILKRTDNNTNNHNIYDEIRLGVENALENTRAISRNLMPPMLESSGLAVALKDYLGNISRKTEISFDVMEDEGTALSPQTEYELFRIIQEFVNNILKYGNCSAVTIGIKNTGDSVSITITDDGIPFDFKQQLAISTGSGLRNITSRLKVTAAEMQQVHMEKGNKFVLKIKKDHA